jgi:hypothetical protein
VPRDAALQSLQKPCRFYVLIIWAKKSVRNENSGNKKPKSGTQEIKRRVKKTEGQKIIRVKK